MNEKLNYKMGSVLFVLGTINHSQWCCKRADFFLSVITKLPGGVTYLTQGTIYHAKKASLSRGKQITFRLKRILEICLNTGHKRVNDKRNCHLQEDFSKSRKVPKNCWGLLWILIPELQEVNSWCSFWLGTRTFYAQSHYFTDPDTVDGSPKV